ncbi:cleavage stimulation factor subunit 1-like isoform X5 [Branchiostoma floridae]|uniref:Cleavage stimulation factor 50 kDa subunit n=1 Tax=Branchiostoma floridae TaxID=7739 RepID=A0A9J7MBC7_BRAFL|nr:cleavage stimulation factor subunit 1-like isoform X5 [Branchiostoma floridae]
MTANVKVDGIKDREQLYKLVIGQLYYDGYESVAASLAKVVRLQGALTPSDRLLRLTKLALVTEEGTKQNSLTKERVAPGGGIDLEFESDVVTISPEAALYETCYVTSHKAQCRASAFTCDGQLIATGSVDASIKVLDVDRMLAKSAQAPEQAAQETPQQNMENHPVIRTLYDHIEEVTCLDYHPQYPNVQLLASGSKDYTVKFFDFTKPSVKRATKSIQVTSSWLAHSTPHYDCMTATLCSVLCPVTLQTSIRQLLALLNTAPMPTCMSAVAKMETSRCGMESVTAVLPHTHGLMMGRNTIIIIIYCVLHLKPLSCGSRLQWVYRYITTVRLPTPVGIQIHYHSAAPDSSRYTDTLPQCGSRLQSVYRYITTVRLPTPVGIQIHYHSAAPDSSRYTDTLPRCGSRLQSE